MAITYMILSEFYMIHVLFESHIDLGHNSWCVYSQIQQDNSIMMSCMIQNEIVLTQQFLNRAGQMNLLWRLVVQVTFNISSDTEQHHCCFIQTRQYSNFKFGCVGIDIRVKG